APERRPVRRHFPGKLIVGGLVLVIGVGSGIALMSQSERLGVAPALQRAADGVVGLGEEAKKAVRSGTRWVEDLAWQLRGGRDTAGDGAFKAPSASDSEPAAPPAGESSASAGSASSTQSVPASPASPPAPESTASSPNRPLPAAPQTAPAPTAPGDVRAPAGGSEVAALPDVRGADAKPRVPSPGFAGLVEQRARQGDPEAQH